MFPTLANRLLSRSGSILLLSLLASSAAAAADSSLEQVAPGVWRIHLGEPEAQTPIRFREQFREYPPRLDRLAALPPCKQLPFRASAVQFKAVPRGSALELPLQDGEQIYGLGMNLKMFQLLGTKRTVRVNEEQIRTFGDSHAPAPFYVSTRGYGVYVDTARYASFYFGDLDPGADSAGNADNSGGRRGPPGPRRR